MEARNPEQEEVRFQMFQKRLQRFVRRDTVEVIETTDLSHFEAKEDENNNEKDFDQEDNTEDEDEDTPISVPNNDY